MKVLHYFLTTAIFLLSLSAIGGTAVAQRPPTDRHVAELRISSTAPRSRPRSSSNAWQSARFSSMTCPCCMAPGKRSTKPSAGARW